MNRFVKIVFRVAVILLIPGVLLLTVGGAMGGLKSLRSSVFAANRGYSNHTRTEVRAEEQAIPQQEFPAVEPSDPLPVPDQQGTNVPSQAPQTTAPAQPPAGGIQGEIHSLDFEVGAAELILQQGDSFALEVEGSTRYRSWQEHGKWKIEMQPSYPGEISTFYVTIPQNAEFLEVELSVGAGTIVADSLTCGKASIEVGAGTAQIDKLVSGQCDIEVGAGYVQVDGGRLSGKTDIECGLGSVELNVERPESYGGSIELAMGSVTIDGTEYTSVSQEQRIGSLASTVLYEIECSMGSVEIRFTN